MLLSSALGGCYASHTADEELLDIEFPDDTYPDAGAAVPDSGRGGCNQTDPIQRAICQFTQGFGGRGDTDDLGGGNKCTQTDPIQQAICQFTQGAGGGGAGGPLVLDPQTIIDLLGGAGGGGQQPSLEDLLASLGGSGDLTSLIEDFLGGRTFPRRDAGAPQQPQQPEQPEQPEQPQQPDNQLTAEKCAVAQDPATRFFCALQGFSTPSLFPRRDGGSLFPRPTTRDAGAPVTEPADAGVDGGDTDAGELPPPVIII